MQTAAAVSNISKRFGSATVLDGVSFDVGEGEIVVLLGASGSGKTTILRIIAGLEAADTGSVHLHQKDVTGLPARLRGVGVIFQSYALFPKMTVEENIAFGLRIRKLPRQKIRERVDELIRLVHLDEHRHKRPTQLSGGQQQRVAIARALAYNPEILLFDEPFSALDAQIRSRLRREIRRLLKEIRIPAIFITHDQEEALEIADRIAVVNGGVIEQIATPFEIYNRPTTTYVAKFLGTANVLAGIVREKMFECESIGLPVPDEYRFSDGQPVELVFRPEDVFLRHPANLTQEFHEFASGWVTGISFGGSSEKVSIRLDLKDELQILATRPKTETEINPLEVGQRVEIGLVRYLFLGLK